MIIESASSTAFRSWSALTVNVCAVFQLVAVKVRNIGVTASPSPGDGVIVTSCPGFVSKTTVYVAESPPSSKSK